MTVISLPRLKMCKICSNVAVAYDGKCLNHTTANRNLRNYTARPKPAAKAKNPFGIELECVHPEGERRLPVVSRFVCSDGSLGYGGAEIKLCAEATKLGDKAADVAQRARLAGGKVNNSCGLHVHMSLPVLYTTGRNTKVYKSIGVAEAENLFPYITGLQNTFFDLVPPSRRDNTYCKPVRRASDIFDHYSWLSVSQRVPTIEVRIHPGTLNPWKVKAWIDVCQKLQAVLHSVLEAKPSPHAETAAIGNFINNEDIPPTTLASKYLRARRDNNGTLTTFGF